MVFKIFGSKMQNYDSFFPLIWLGQGELTK